jgi:hypothetical protein
VGRRGKVILSKDIREKMDIEGDEEGWGRHHDERRSI